MTYASQLPSVAEVHAFMEVINTGRDALGLDRIDTLDYDACDPSNPRACLSATHLFGHAGLLVYDQNVKSDLGPGPYTTAKQRQLAAALGMEPSLDEGWLIPEVIKKVTDPFDQIQVGDEIDQSLDARMRDRLTEAGVI